jgi:tetraacyldisaccharide 4'-kinase
MRDSQVFPDHHRFTLKELGQLLSRASELDATLVTTPKDAVRLPPDIRAKVTVIGVHLAWEDLSAIEALLTDTLGLTHQ